MFWSKAIFAVIQHFQFWGFSVSCSYEQCTGSFDFCVVSIYQFSETVLCRPRVPIWSVCLWPCNHETIKSRIVQSQYGGGQRSTAFKCKSCRWIFDSRVSYTDRQHRTHQFAQGTECLDPSNMTEFTFQKCSNIVTGILWGTGHNRWDIGIVILIIPNYTHHYPRNN